MKTKGFTLLEILLVIAAIGILAAIVIVAINPNRQLAQARDAERVSETNQIHKALEQYLIDNSSYPTVVEDIPAGGVIEICADTAVSCANLLDMTASLVPEYLSGIPTTPEASGNGAGYLVHKSTGNAVGVSSFREVSESYYYAGVESGGYLLREYPGATGAYSLRRINDEYVGDAIRVRRSSDNAEQDIGFDDYGRLDESALTAFVGGGNGLVVTWYDQSGNGYNLSQVNAIRQPVIVLGGVVETLNGRPGLNFTGNKGVFVNGITEELYTVFGLVESPTSIWTQYHTILDGYGNFERIGGIMQINQSGIHNNVSPSAAWRNGQSITVAPAGVLAPITEPMLITYNKDLTRGTVSGIAIGNYDGGGLGGAAVQSEVIVYPTDQTMNRVQIESNINDFYSIY